MPTALVRASFTLRLLQSTDSHSIGEAFLGKWFTETGRRPDIFLATKFGGLDLSADVTKGQNKWVPNSKPSYIRRQVQNSLSDLKTDHIDLYYQHRVDPNVPIEVVLETLRPYVESGQIRWLGLSECSAATLRRARAVSGVGEKVVAVQMEFSPFELGIEKSGFVEAVNEAGVSVVAYSPLARGLVSGRYVPSLFWILFGNLDTHCVFCILYLGRYHSPSDFDEDDARKFLPRFSETNFAKNLEIVEKIKTVADKCNATTSQVALAWILAEHPNCSFLILFIL